MTKVKTTRINMKGRTIDYPLVKDRVQYFLEEYPNGYIDTDVKFFEEKSIALCKAVVMFHKKEASLSQRFTGHAMGPVNAEKSLEKLETVAVGRALAFAGIGIIESISSADEINLYKSRQTNSTVPEGPVRNKKVPYTNDPQSKHKDVYQEVDLKDCDKCGSGFKLIPAGINQVGRPYDDFYACSSDSCKRTLSVEAAGQWLEEQPGCSVCVKPGYACICSE